MALVEPSQRALVDFAADLHAYDEEEHRHHRVVDPEVQIRKSEAEPAGSKPHGMNGQRAGSPTAMQRPQRQAARVR